MRRTLSSLSVCTLAFAAIATAPLSTGAAPRWAPASRATIYPGVQVFTGATQCTSNFVFYDSRSIYLGLAAHCFGVVDWTDERSGCEQYSFPPGATVDIQGASRRGTLVYNSRHTMQRVGERDPVVCAVNDFALVRIHRADHKRVNPSLPFWGGPTGPNGTSTLGKTVFSYGNSMLRAGISQLSPKFGLDTGESHRAIGRATGWGLETAGWVHDVHTVTGPLPGDSGSAFLDSTGRALGILATLSLDGSTGVVDFSKATRYMKAKTRLDAIKLAVGTAKFVGPA